MYKGWTTLPLDEASLAKYYQGELKVTDYVNLKENEYCAIEHNSELLANEIWKKKNGKVQKVSFQTIGSDETSSKAKPRNPQQVMEFDLINDASVPVKTVVGTWGSFKTGAFARAADKTHVWINGDWRQRDRSIFEKSRGIETLIERLAGNKLFGYVYLEKSERSEVAALADLLKTENEY